MTMLLRERSVYPDELLSTLAESPCVLFYQGQTDMEYTNKSASELKGNIKITNHRIRGQVWGSFLVRARNYIEISELTLSSRLNVVICVLVHSHCIELFVRLEHNYFLDSH